MYILHPMIMPWHRFVVDRRLLSRLKKTIRCSHNGCGKVFREGDAVYAARSTNKTRYVCEDCYGSMWV